MVDKYIDYFRNLAVTHDLLLHNPEAESNQADPEEKKFTIWGADEVVTGLKTAIGFPALLLEMFELTTKGENSAYAIKGSYLGAISVFDRVAYQDFADQKEKAAGCYNILEELLRKIWQDHYGSSVDGCSSPFSKFNFNNLDINYVGPLFDNMYGWRCEFSFEPKHTLNLNIAPTHFIENA